MSVSDSSSSSSGAYKYYEIIDDDIEGGHNHHYNNGSGIAAAAASVARSTEVIDGNALVFTQTSWKHIEQVRGYILYLFYQFVDAFASVMACIGIFFLRFHWYSVFNAQCI